MDRIEIDGEVYEVSLENLDVIATYLAKEGTKIFLKSLKTTEKPANKSQVLLSRF